MLKNLKADNLYIVCGHTDMRKSIDGLASIVQQKYNLDLFDNSAFLFCGRRRDYLLTSRKQSKKLKAVWISTEFSTADMYINVEDISQLRYALFLERNVILWYNKFTTDDLISRKGAFYHDLRRTEKSMRRILAEML